MSLKFTGTSEAAKRKRDNLRCHLDNVEIAVAYCRSAVDGKQYVDLNQYLKDLQMMMSYPMGGLPLPKDAIPNIGRHPIYESEYEIEKDKIEKGCTKDLPFK